MTTLHSKIGASGAERWMNCPGSVKLSEKMENKSSSYAREGTAAHALAEACLSEPGKVDASSMIGQVFENHKVTQEMAEAVNVYLQDAYDDWEEGDEVEYEVGFNLDVLHPGMFGTADRVRYRPSTRNLLVTDYKHGAGVPVEVADNPQLLYYAIGAAYAKSNRGIEEVELRIVQPRCPHSDGPVRSWTVSAAFLLDFAQDLIDAARATELPNAPLIPGEWCHWCPAAATCPALHKKANDLARNEFVPGLEYDPSLLAEVLENLPMIESWIASVRSFAYAEAESGRMPPGFKLVAKRATRKWKDEEAAIKFLLDNKVDTKQIYTSPLPELKSPAQIELVLGKARKGIIGDLVVAISSGNTLAPIADRRAPATQRVNAKDDFASSDVPEVQ